MELVSLACVLKDTRLRDQEAHRQVLRVNRLKYRGSSVSVEQVEECSMHPISSRDENDSQYSTEEVSQLFRSTSRGAFPQK